MKKSAKRAPRFEGYSPSSARASETARSIGRKDTKAELMLRSALWRSGLRYRKNDARLPGRPDIVFVKARVAVFVDGDFWHGRDWEARRAKLQTGTNARYWLAKITANMERDQSKTQLLEEAGWKVMRFWETDVLRDVNAAVQLVHAALGLDERAALPDPPLADGVR